MSDPGKLITRQEVYEAVWQHPISKLAPIWNTKPTSIINACDKMNIPRPGPGHWALVKRGWAIERTPLPPPERDTPIGASVAPPAKKREAKPASALEKPYKQRRKVDIPKDFTNAHRFVRQTRKALTTDTYLHNGFVNTRSDLERPLNLTVSREGLDRALLICDAIIRGVIDEGGRFEAGPERWRLRLFIGKQPVWFSIREAMKRFDLDMTEEEKKAKGYFSWDKYGWRASGVLRLSVGMEGLGEWRWEDSKRLSLDEQVGEIIDEIAKAEETAAKIKAERAKYERERAEERARQEAEWARREAARKEAERLVRIEEESRSLLVQKARDWRDARILRRFIGACEEKMGEQKQLFPGGSWEERWLTWAREHANRLDPMTSGYLEAEQRRISEPGGRAKDAGI